MDMRLIDRDKSHDDTCGYCHGDSVELDALRTALVEAEAKVAAQDEAMEIVRAVANGTTPTRFANYLIFHVQGPHGEMTAVELRKQARALLAAQKVGGRRT